MATDKKKEEKKSGGPIAVLGILGLAVGLGFLFTRKKTPPPNSASLSGTITDILTGLPVANALVQVGSASGRSNALGNYELTGIPPETYTLTCTRADYQTVSMTVSLAVGDNFQDIELTPAASLTGIVTDYDTGFPIVHANVQIGSRLIETDGAGSYILRNLEPGSVTVFFSASGYFSTDETVILAPGPNIYSVQLHPLATLFGQVKDALTGLVIAGAPVSLGAMSTESDSFGMYSFHDIATGTYPLNCTVAGYQEYSVEVTLVKGEQYHNINLIPPAQEVLIANYENVGNGEEVYDHQLMGREFRVPFRARLTRLQVPCQIYYPYNVLSPTMTLEIRKTPVDGSPQLPELIVSVTIDTPSLANYPGWTWVEFTLPAGLVLEPNVIYSWWLRAAASPANATFRISRVGDALIGSGNLWLWYLGDSNPPQVIIQRQTTRAYHLYGIPV